MKKKLVSVLLTAAMVATMAVGCGGGSSDGGSDSSDSDGGGSGKEMTYWSMWNSTEAQAKVIQEAADAYEEETGIHINIRVEGP